MDTTNTGALHIFLADDDTDDRFFFDRALKQLPVVHHLTQFENGELLMQHLTQQGIENPDIIFTDVNMPRMNGVECLTQIKASDALRDIPVIIHSTSVPDPIAAKLYEIGAQYYLQKSPFIEMAANLQHVLDLVAQNPNQPPRDQFIIGAPKSEF